MKITVICSVLVAALFGVAQAEEDAAKPVTLARALKLGPEKLAEATDASEVGQDRACQLYAAAKRLETENKLAARDLQQVVDLDDWRRPLQRCTGGFCELAYGLMGGGSLYSHAANRSGADVEGFLAGFAKGLPFAEGKGDPASLEKLDRLIAFVGKLQCPADTEAGTASAFMEQRTDELAMLKELKTLCIYAPALPVKDVVAFVVKSASWVDFPESGKRKVE